ncbi:MAG: RNA-binding protein [Alphaproteobacteria bacterium]|nr:RNA-binding protein [Alphaproteobacteria bacterium]
MEGDVAEADHASTTRRCLVTGTTAETTLLVRFVVGPDDRVVPDIAAKLPGRGLWVMANREAVREARSRFSRAAKQKVEVPADLDAIVEAQLVRRCSDLLGLARKASLAVAGFEKVRALLAAGEAGLLLAAANAAEDGKRKLWALAGGVPVVGHLTIAELSLPLGRENVVHAALRPGGLTNRVVSEAARLAGFRGATQATGRRTVTK